MMPGGEVFYLQVGVLLWSGGFYGEWCPITLVIAATGTLATMLVDIFPSQWDGSQPFRWLPNSA